MIYKAEIYCVLGQNRKYVVFSLDLSLKYRLFSEASDFSGVVILVYALNDGKMVSFWLGLTNNSTIFGIFGCFYC